MAKLVLNKKTERREIFKERLEIDKALVLTRVNFL
jgi:hypothetical protein